MKSLKQALKDYLRIRRSLGFRLRNEEGLLRNFVAFLHAAGAPYVTWELALRWATQPATAQPATWAWHLRMVRRFAIWHSAIDPRTEIPPVGLLPHRYRRKSPHIYSDEELEKLLRRTQQLPSPKGLRAHTYTTLFGLLVATGMRVNEALGLNRSDVDLQLGILHIRRAKFGKSRYVPVHASTVEALKKYAETEIAFFPHLSLRRSLSPNTAAGSQATWRDTPSPKCPNNSASAPQPKAPAAVPACRTCVIDSPPAP